MLRSCEPGSFFVAAQAAFGVQELALSDIEALFGHRLPFVQTRLAQGDAFGAGLQAGLAVGLEVDEVDDVVHFKISNQIFSHTTKLDLTLKF